MDPALTAHAQNGFRVALRDFGLWVVYTRSDHRFRCTQCFDLDTNESPADCDFCFGTGYKVQLERWFAVYSNSLIRAGAFNPLGRVGWMTEHKPYIFSDPTLVPTRGDRYFIVEWDRPMDQVGTRGAVPVRILEVLRSVFVEPNIAGKLIYFTNACEFVTETKERYESVLLGTPIRVTRPAAI